MDWISTIAYIITNVFSTYGFFILIDGCMKKRNRRVSRKFLILGYVTFSILQIVHYLFITQSNAIANMILSLVLAFLLCMLYRGSMLRRIFITALSYCLYAFGDIGVALVMSTISDEPIFDLLTTNPWMNTLGIILSTAIFLLLTFISVKIYQTKNCDDSDVELPRPYLFTAVLLPTLSVAVAVLLIGTAYNNGILSVPAICLCVILLIAINVLVLNLYSHLLKEQAAKLKDALIKQQNLAYAHELHLMQQTNQQIRAMRHDMKNHLLSIREMVSSGNTEALNQYLDRFSAELATKQEYLHTGITELDSIVNYKLSQAEKIGAEVEANAVIPVLHEKELNPFDISVIMGNLLDNAIEAVRIVDDKRISVKVWFEKGIVHIEVENTFDGTIIKSNKRDGGYLTRKEQNGQHGIGLSSVKSIINQYHGIMSISDENNIFSVSILLYPHDN